MNYNQATSFLYNSLPMYQRIGAAAYKADLTNTIKLSKLLHNPQNTFKSIHIAGTNGKGSVAHMLASILQSSGYKTGLYTSPHLTDFRERIKINGQPIDRKYVSNFVARFQEDFISMGLSFFEMTVGIAFQYFQDKKVDVAVIETGMGGRLDSTNIIHPILAIITNIGMDHTIFLGNTIEKIAWEKAGIIKKNSTVIIGESQERTIPVFAKKAKEQDATLLYADQIYQVSKKDDTSSVFYGYKGNALLYENIKLDLEGSFQKKNLTTVLMAVDILTRHLKNIKKTTIEAGLSSVKRQTRLQGRWQKIGNNPLIITDIGHNRAAFTEIMCNIETITYHNLHMVLGFVADKNIEDIFSILPKDAIYYFSKPNIPRGLDASELAAKAKESGIKGNTYSSAKNALQEAKKNALKNDFIFVGGSTFLVADILQKNNDF